MTALAAGHVFWCLLAVACLVWYSTVTIYVAIRGARDIQAMLRRLQARRAPAAQPPAAPPPTPASK